MSLRRSKKSDEEVMFIQWEGKAKKAKKHFFATFLSFSPILAIIGTNSNLWHFFAFLLFLLFPFLGISYIDFYFSFFEKKKNNNR